MIPYGRQWLDEDDIQEVIKVLSSEFLTQGPKIKEFEDYICELTGAKYCVAVSNGTAALDIAVKSLQLPSGCSGITSPNTFVASANCMVYNSINPVFSDINKETYNIDPVEIEKKITGCTKLIIPVHFAGQPCEMKEISAIARSHGLKVVEDGAHAIGTAYKDGSWVGDCRYSDLTTFSFHPVKTVTSGEGGAVTTNDPELYDRMMMLRTHGITKDPEKMTVSPGPWYYEMQVLGDNYRMTDIQAALGLSQLRKLRDFTARRREIVAEYNSGLSGIGWLKTPFEREDVSSAFHLYVVRIDFEELGKSRTQVMEELKECGIGTQVHYIPVHTQPFYIQLLNTRWGDYPVSEKFYSEALSIPLFPKMSASDVKHVIKSIRQLKDA